MGEDYIAHYGTPKQKWGHRNYQYPDGTYTELGKERRRVGTGERRPLLTEEEKRQRREAYYDRKEAIRKGDVIYANQHISEFSNDELDEIIARYSKNKRISELTAEIESKDKLTLEKVAKKLGTIADIAGSTSSILVSMDKSSRALRNMSDRKNGKDNKDNDKKDKKDKKKKDKKKSSGGFFKIINKSDAKGEDIYQYHNRKDRERSRDRNDETERLSWRDVDEHFDKDKRKFYK